MNKFDKNIDNIRNLVGELPSNYLTEKEFIINKLALFEEKKLKDVSTWLYEYVYSLPYKVGWKRKHIYLLTHELLNYRHIDLDDIFYNIESGIIGDCAIECIKKYDEEPNNQSDLAEYVRNYQWLI